MPNIGTTSKLVLAFVTLLLGAVLVAVIATQSLAVTEKTGAPIETFLLTSETEINSTGVNASVEHTIANPPTNWKVDDCPITNFVLENSTGSDYTITTDYLITASTGVFTFVDNAALNNSIHADSNNTYVHYTYCGDDYMNLSWGRTSINLVPGFFAIALLLISVGLFYSVAKDYGIIGK